MGLLKGTINCKSDEEIPIGAVLKLQVLYIVDNDLKKVKLVSKTENPHAFPIPFAIDYTDEFMFTKSSLYCFLRATIEKDGEILFKNYGPASSISLDSSTNTNSTINALSYYGDLIGRNNKLRKHLDVYLNYMPSPISKNNSIGSATRLLDSSVNETGNTSASNGDNNNISWRNIPHVGKINA